MAAIILASAHAASVDSPIVSATVGELREDEVRIRQLFVRHGCRHVYLDVGSNIGVQMRKLFEPHKYAGAAVLPVFDSIFGPAPRCRVCAIGFEPNLKHRRRLANVQEALTAAGAGVLVFEAAVGSADGVLELQVENASHSQYNFAGSSTLTPKQGAWRGHVSQMVRMVRLSRIIQLVDRLLASRSSHGRIVAKLDIEGAELTVLPDLMATGALCLLHNS